VSATTESLRDAFFYFLGVFALWMIRVEWKLNKLERRAGTAKEPE